MSKYENGYQGKIEYHADQLIKAVKAGDPKAIKRSKESVEFFSRKQIELIESRLSAIEWFDDNDDVDPAGGRGLQSHE
ncbi:MAG: hypothetical protein ACFFKA_12945 [Candidatus Thorarchaeota archaeon]